MPEVQEGLKTTYTLSESDFTGPKPKKFATSYSLGERITRTNFTAFIIDSFAKSRGNFAAQIAIFEWTRHRTGLD